MLNLTYFDEYITSDEENDFEEKDLIEEGEVVDPMQIQQLEESESEEDAAEHKQDDNGTDIKPEIDEALESYFAMPFETKNLLTCDELFAIYLRHTCWKVNSKFYKNIIMFVLLFRECMNEYGWQKKQENLKILQGERIEVPEEALKHRMPDGSKPSTMHAAQLTL